MPVCCCECVAIAGLLGAVRTRENDSRSQDLRHPGETLRMIPILTREVLFENDSHYHRQKAL